MKGLGDKEGHGAQYIADLRARIALMEQDGDTAAADGLRNPTPESLRETVRKYQALISNIIQTAQANCEDPRRHLSLMGGLMTNHAGNVWNDFQMVRGAERKGTWYLTQQPVCCFLTFILAASVSQLQALFEEERQQNLHRIDEWRHEISDARTQLEYKDAVKNLGSALPRPTKLRALGDKLSGMVRPHVSEIPSFLLTSFIGAVIEHDAARGRLGHRVDRTRLHRQHGGRTLHYVGANSRAPRRLRRHHEEGPEL